MELKEYIKKVLIEISEGVLEAQKELKDTDAIVNPARLKLTENGTRMVKEGQGSRHVQEVEINVAVTGMDKSGGKSGIGVLTGILSAGGQVSNEKQNEVVSTIKFTIPVALPTVGDKEPKAKVTSRVL